MSTALPVKEECDDGLVAACVGIIVGVLTMFVASQVLTEQPIWIREPIAQGLAFLAAFLSVWPWMKRQGGFTDPPAGWAGILPRAGFLEYALWIVLVASAMTTVRLAF